MLPTLFDFRLTHKKKTPYKQVLFIFFKKLKCSLVCILTESKRVTNCTTLFFIDIQSTNIVK